MLTFWHISYIMATETMSLL